MSKKENPTEEKLEEQVQEVARETENAGGRVKLAQQFGTVDITLSKPFTWCDKTYEEVHLDFEGLTGVDMEAIDDMIGVAGLRGLVPAYSRLYQRLLCSRASGMPSDAIEHLPLVDYNAMINAAQYFLIVTG